VFPPIFPKIGGVQQHLTNNRNTMRNRIGMRLSDLTATISKNNTIFAIIRVLFILWQP
jgi:hypothetical protein